MLGHATQILEYYCSVSIRATAEKRSIEARPTNGECARKFASLKTHRRKPSSMRKQTTSPSASRGLYGNGIAKRLSALGNCLSKRSRSQIAYLGAAVTTGPS